MGVETYLQRRLTDRNHPLSRDRAPHFYTARVWSLSDRKVNKPRGGQGPCFRWATGGTAGTNIGRRFSGRAGRVLHGPVSSGPALGGGAAAWRQPEVYPGGRLQGAGRLEAPGPGETLEKLWKNAGRRVSRGPLGVDGLACGSRGASTNKGQQVLPFIRGMWPLMSGPSDGSIKSCGMLK
jgi:hypothetical protein